MAAVLLPLLSSALATKSLDNANCIPTQSELPIDSTRCYSCGGKEREKETELMIELGHVKGKNRYIPVVGAIRDFYLHLKAMHSSL